MDRQCSALVPVALPPLNSDDPVTMRGQLSDSFKKDFNIYMILSSGSTKYFFFFVFKNR